MQNDLRVRMIGRRDGIPDQVLRELDKTVDMSSGNGGMQLNLAINYGGRAELVDAARALARDVARGALQPEQIDEAAISERLYTAGLDDPDLLVRTAGEMRISNFLLWQAAYAELYFTECLWPDFGEAEIDAALTAFAQRDRRFGGILPPTVSPEAG
jgi:undecaprenyl diphosphate synthase